MAQPKPTQSRADLLVRSVTDYAIYMLDPSGIISSWNPGAERLKGYGEDEILGEHFSKFYTETDLATGVPERALRTALRDGRLEAEGWRVRKDGTRFWANVVIDPIRDENGQHLGFAKVTRDLSERKAADEALRRSEERFRLLVQGVTDYAIYMLDPEGHVSSWNAGAERFKGYAPDEIIGEHFSRFYRPEDIASGVPTRALETARETGRFEAEGWRVRKDGTPFWASVVIDRILDPEGKLVGFAKITRDLSERKKAQEALEQTQQQFFQAQKVEAIGKLTGGVAHDFNNLLAAILGSLELARKRLKRGEDISGFIDNAIQAAQRGATLTQRMLAFARKQDLTLEAVDLPAAVHDMAELLARTIGPKIVIDTRFPLVLPPVRADRTQLELAILNLAVNARDAMPEGGRITLAAEHCRAPNAKPDDPMFVCLSLTDTGEGMDAAVLERATEPFFTTKGVGKGTGLGLSMVHGMAEQVGGYFELTSALGHGTTATLWLPIAEDLVIAALPDAAPMAAASRRILAVDDDDLVLLNTVMMLEDQGHTVLQARSGAEALQVLERERIDVLVTDYAMPGMTGQELLGRALKMQPAVKAVIVTGYADLPSGEHLNAPRLAKPFSEADLAATIARVCGSGF